VLGHTPSHLKDDLPPASESLTVISPSSCVYRSSVSSNKKRAPFTFSSYKDISCYKDIFDFCVISHITVSFLVDKTRFNSASVLFKVMSTHKQFLPPPCLDLFVPIFNFYCFSILSSLNFPYFLASSCSHLLSSLSVLSDSPVTPGLLILNLSDLLFPSESACGQCPISSQGWSDHSMDRCVPIHQQIYDHSLCSSNTLSHGRLPSAKVVFVHSVSFLAHATATRSHALFMKSYTRIHHKQRIPTKRRLIRILVPDDDLHYFGSFQSDSGKSLVLRCRFAASSVIDGSTLRISLRNKCTLQFSRCRWPIRHIWRPSCHQMAPNGAGRAPKDTRKAPNGNAAGTPTVQSGRPPRIELSRGKLDTEKAPILCHLDAISCTSGAQGSTQCVPNVSLSAPDGSRSAPNGAESELASSL